jgi:hypothetical protein
LDFQRFIAIIKKSAYKSAAGEAKLVVHLLKRCLMKRTCLIMTIALLAFSCSKGQQKPDDSFNPEIKNPAYSLDQGPVIFVDEGHANFHTITWRYRPFAKIIERDGYVVKSAKAKISIELLKGCKVFVISVPTSKGNQSAYTNGEIRILKDWVMAGGSLLLITDHMPDPPAIAELAEAFGITVNNGYVLNEDPNESKGPVFFRRNDGTLADHPITNGREGFDERIGSVTSFTGCAFKASVDFKPLLIFGPHKTSWMTKEPGKFPDDTPKIDVEGWYQGGVQEYGKGRLAFFGEAGMFTAQIITGGEVRRFGMNVPIAKGNAQFLLNVFHWLSGIL